MNTFIKTECRNFKTFLKEHYAVVLNSCYTRYVLKNVGYGIEHDVNSAYGVCIYYRLSWTL